MPRLLGQKAHQGHRVLQLAGQEDLPGQAAPAAVVLPHQGGEDVRPVLLHGCLDELPVLGRQLALHIVEHHEAAPGGLPLVEAHHVGVRQGARHHLLPLAQQLDGLEAVPQLGGLLEAQLLRRLLHLGQQLLPHLLELPLQQAHRLVDGLPVAGLIHLLPAVAVTLAHVVIQAGPLLSDVSGELPAARGQLQGDAQGVDDILGAPPAAVGAEVPRPVLRRPVGQGEAGVGLLHRQADVGVALVVLEQDVVVGLVALDEGVLQNQRLKLRVGHNHVEVVNLAHHGPGLLRVGGQVCEVLAHPVLQRLGLAHVDDLVFGVLHDIHARLQRQGMRFFLEFVESHNRGSMPSSLPGSLMPCRWTRQRPGASRRPSVWPQAKPRRRRDSLPPRMSNHPPGAPNEPVRLGNGHGLFLLIRQRS